MNCIICHSLKIIPLYNIYDDRYGYPGTFLINKCTECGHKFLADEFNPELLKILYTDYYARSTFHLDRYHPAKEVRGFQSWLNGEGSLAYSWVPDNVRVLDIGCGFGETLGYHTARGCDVYGVEADENIRRVADKFGFKVHVGLFDASLYDRDFFDYITMDQVIEHVTDPIATLKGIAQVLKSGGSAIVSTPNANSWGNILFRRRWIHWHAPYHLQHFSVASMTLAAQQAGLSVTEVKTITDSDWLLYQWIRIFTQTKIGEPSFFWSSRGKVNKKTQSLIHLITLVHKTKLDHLLTRLFDAFRMGDNYVFFLKKN